MTKRTARTIGLALCMLSAVMAAFGIGVAISRFIGG